MAISRAQLEQQIQRLADGGTVDFLKTPEVVSETEVLEVKPEAPETTVDPMQAQINAMLAAMKPKTPEPFDFDKSYKKYAERLKPYFSQSTRPTFYDLASDIGAAMLSADPRAGAFRSAGVGFSNFNDRLRKSKESRIALDRQVGLQAMQMAMADEKSAKDYLNKIELERIKLANQPYKPIIYEVPTEDGGVKTVEVNPSNQFEVAAIRMIPGAKQIKLPTSTVSVDSRVMPPSTLEKKAGEALIELEETWIKDASTAVSQNQLTNQFMLQLARLGEEGWGRIATGTLPARQVLSELGVRADESLDNQQLALTLGTRIAMGLIGDTKGAITEMEMRLFLAASPTLSSTYKGALKQAAFLQRIANLNIKKAEDYNKAVAEGLLKDAETDSDKLRLAQGWELSWRQKSENQFLTAGERSELQALASQEPEAAKAFRESFFADMQTSPSVNTDLSGIAIKKVPKSGE
jgi:hypothetical protein